MLVELLTLPVVFMTMFTVNGTAAINHVLLTSRSCAWLCACEQGSQKSANH